MAETIEIRSFKSGKKYRYLIRNISNVEMQLSTPISSTPLPLSGDEQNVLVKSDGNSLRINVSWVLHDDDDDVILPNNYDVNGNNVGGGTTLYGTGLVGALHRQADSQMKFLLNAQTSAFSGFQVSDIDDNYQIIIGETKFSRQGLIESLSISKSGTTPITWAANLAFISGDVATI